jgi:hypothetical protein
MAARDDDFFGGGIDPFTGLAPAEDPSVADAAARLRLQRSATATANINNAPGGYAQQRARGDRENTSGKSVDELLRRQAAGDPLVTPAVLAAARKLDKQNREAMNTLGYKVLTGGILAAPALVTGGAAAFGGSSALGFGEAAGEGSLVGSSAPQLAYAASDTAGAEAAMNAAYAANATAPTVVPAGLTPAALAATAPTAAAAAPAAAGTSALATVAEGSKDALTALAPLGIQLALGGKTKEDKALLAKQKQLAAEAQVRQGQAQDARMNKLGQQLLAFNPYNQLMAQMYGPQAAFSPEQAAQMVQGQAPNWDLELYNYQGNDQEKLKAKREMIRRKNEYDQAESSRRDMMMNNVQQPGPGPAPIQMSAPQAARKY